MFRRLLAVLGMFASLGPISSAQIDGDHDRKIDLPINEWLANGEHKDFKGKLRIQEPLLTFQQRHRVRVVSTYDVRALQKSSVKRDLHFILKVADESGRWFRGESYVESKLEAPVAKGAALEIVSELNVLPGRYRVAAIMYDSVEKQRSVQVARVKVDPLKNDPLPNIDRSLPRVEFLPEADRNVSQFGIGRLSLPVNNRQPLAVDVVFDVSAPSIRGSTRLGSLTASRQVQVANVIADLKLQSGCMRFTGIDLLRQESLFERVPGQQIDWLQIRAEILKRNLNTISIENLAASDQVARFLKMEFEKVLASPVGCSLSNQPAKRVIIVLSGGVLFPVRTKGARVKKESMSAYEVFYLRAGRILPFDDVPGVLKELSPHRIQADDPEDFRKELRHLISHLEQL